MENQDWVTWKDMKHPKYCIIRTGSKAMCFMYIYQCYWWLIRSHRTGLNVNTYKGPGGWFNIEMPPYQYRKSFCGDKTILRLSYLHNGLPILVRWHLYIESYGKRFHVMMSSWSSTTMPVPTMTSSNGSIFRVTGHLCGEFTAPRWIPCT